MKFSDILTLARDHSAKVVLGFFVVLGFVFPALGSRIETLKQPTADLITLYVNTLVPHEQQIGAVPLSDGNVILTQQAVADKANAE